jgi:peptidyl-dipeptidase Dcp
MPFELQPWDWDFYADQILFEQYSVDPNQVKPYFELNRVLVDGAFYAAQQLFGLSFKARNDLKGYRPDVRVFEVFDADGSGLGLFLFDPFARDNKQGGAWMNSIVNQSTLFKTRPVVLNNLNVPFPGEGVPVLLTFDEVTTLFHEFGHALHGLLSNVRYSSLSGTRVPRDFGEYPSQYNEMWARDPEVVKHFAHHHQSGEPLPTELLNKVIRAQKFDQGFATTSYVASAVLDQAWHQLPPSKLPQPDQVMAFENKVLRDAGFDYAPVTARYRSTYFSHIYSGGYAASYYAYLWSEVLARDTGEWLIKRGGLKRANGDVLRAKILSRGRSQEPNDLFEAFYGAPPNGDALLEYRGLK